MSSQCQVVHKTTNLATVKEQVKHGLDELQIFYAQPLCASGARKNTLINVGSERLAK